MDKHLTVCGTTCQETIIKHSKFIAHAKRVNDGEEAMEFVRQIKKKYSDATHNPYAFITGERGECVKFSDDGEPSGTAGQPILEIIKKQDIFNVAVVVTRYFGGIKLGAGGLVRAYADSALNVLIFAKKENMVLCDLVKVTCDYTFVTAVNNLIIAHGGQISSSEYTQNAALDIAMPSHILKTFLTALANTTFGTAVCLSYNKMYVPFNI